MFEGERRHTSPQSPGAGADTHCTSIKGHAAPFYSADEVRHRRVCLVSFRRTYTYKDGSNQIVSDERRSDIPKTRLLFENDHDRAGRKMFHQQ